jgi:hypothetical protein
MNTPNGFYERDTKHLKEELCERERQKDFYENLDLNLQETLQNGTNPNVK